MNKDSNKTNDSDDWNMANSKLADQNMDWSFFDKTQGKKRPAEDSSNNAQNNTSAESWTLNAHQKPESKKDTDGFALPARPPSILKKPKPQIISEVNEEDYTFEIPDPIITNDNNDDKQTDSLDNEATGLIGKLLGANGTDVTLDVKPSDQHDYFKVIDDKSKATNSNQNTQKKKEQPKQKPTINVRPEDDDDELDDVFKMKQYEIEQYGPQKTEEQNDNAQEPQVAPPVEKKKAKAKAFKF